MLLQQGTSGEVISANIGELISAGHSPGQATAIAQSYAQGADRAAGICYTAGDSVLLLLRSPAAADYPLTWAFPGGSIEAGETPEQAAIRESQEEIGNPPADPLRLIDWNDGFTTYAVEMPAPFVPTLNEEHLGYVWCPLDAIGLMPTIHPGCLLTLSRALLRVPVALGMDARTVDGNGWFEVKNNPISKAGIFPYSGRQLGLDGENADRTFRVLRPPEELNNPECIASFKLIPWVDDHTMIGPNAVKVSENALPAEKKGVQGVIGEDVYFRDGVLFANIKAFSSTLAALIEAGKKELSAGYRCVYDMTSGVWNGQAYDAVQRKIRGNHLALVKEGRMGPDVAVMDRFTFSIDAKEAVMADEKGKDAAGEGGAAAGSMTLEQCTSMLNEMAPQLQKLTAAFAALGAPAAEPVADKTPAADAPAATPAAPVAKPEGEGTPAGAVMDEALFVKRFAQRDQLARQISAHVGTFDHSAMTLDSVVAYGCEKLGIKAPKGTEAATLAGFLQAKPAATPPATVAADAAVAPTAGSFVTKHLKGA